MMQYDIVEFVVLVVESFFEIFDNACQHPIKLFQFLAVLSVQKIVRLIFSHYVQYLDKFDTDFVYLQILQPELNSRLVPVE